MGTLERAYRITPQNNLGLFQGFFFRFPAYFWGFLFIRLLQGAVSYTNMTLPTTPYV